MSEHNSSQESFTIIFLWIGSVKSIALSNDGASRRGDTAHAIISLKLGTHYVNN